MECVDQWEAEPALRASITLNELRDKLRWTDGTVEVALDGPDLLGSAPIGQFRAKVRGPLGNARELRFRMISAPEFDRT